MRHTVILESELREDLSCRELIIRTIKTALEAQGVNVSCEVDVLLTDDAGIHEINLEQRGMDKPTDVLSFPMFDLTPGTPPTQEDADPESGLVPLGDIVISVERAKIQAEEYGHSLQRELAYLTVHSILHLLGHDHTDEGPQKALMRRAEEDILSRLGITREDLKA